MSVLHAAVYRFTALDDPAAWRDAIEREARAGAIRGTVLVAHEGINLAVAGEPGALRGFLDWLTAAAPFTGLHATETRCAAAPYRRLRVKVKAEIIRMNQPTVQPQAGRAPSVDAVTLHRWLERGTDDTGRTLVLLDTRNAFEVDHGRFRGAVDWRLPRFSAFPEALARHREALRGQTVVSYCTGGIRCEKAALWMRAAGIEPVLQLEGGILRYFEQTDARHFDGRCFVFDERGALTDRLVASAPV